VFLYFTATKKEDGTRWCPDCENTEAELRAAAAEAPGSSVMVEVEIPRSRWRPESGPAHELRGPPFNVRGIPTLVQYDPNSKGVVGSSLTEVDFVQTERMASFFSSAVASGVVEKE
jgi:hypothetical protein